mmetsp:Transcript_80175/g.163184  ORF Transcript_80175/g.163184 Transcript_80175/m.163184 type:complete len:203 (+) Transcript_80175:948-1556(+)
MQKAVDGHTFGDLYSREDKAPVEFAIAHATIVLIRFLLSGLRSIVGSAVDGASRSDAHVFTLVAVVINAHPHLQVVNGPTNQANFHFHRRWLEEFTHWNFCRRGGVQELDPHLQGAFGNRTDLSRVGIDGLAHQGSVFNGHLSVLNHEFVLPGVVPVFKIQNTFADQQILTIVLIVKEPNLKVGLFGQVNVRFLGAEVSRLH